MSWEPPFSTGTESAEPAGLRRLLRQPVARRNLVFAAAGLAGVLLLMPRGGSAPLRPGTFATVPSPFEPVPVPEEHLEQPAGVLGSPIPQPSLPGSAPTQIGGRVAQSGDAVYTIYLYKLPGLAPDAEPGTIIDLWVTWRPPVTRQPKVQLLVEDVVLERIEAGFEEGPVADLLVSDEDIPDLIYGERFGSFNAVTHPS